MLQTLFYGFIVPAAWLVWHIGFRIKVVGRENIPKEGGFVLASNHLSAVDPVFLVIARFWGKKMIVLGKDEIMHLNPFLTWMFRAVGVRGVERGKGDTDLIDGIIRDMREEGRGLLIFPEGTRSKTGEPGKVKSGAFVIASAVGVPMVPARIIYSTGLLKVFCRARICFGEPIPAEELFLGETKSAAKLRACKNRLNAAWEALYEANKFE